MLSSQIISVSINVSIIADDYTVQFVFSSKDSYPPQPLAKPHTCGRRATLKYKIRRFKTFRTVSFSI